jgi:hypothetical protein
MAKNLKKARELLEEIMDCQKELKKDLDEVMELADWDEDVGTSRFGDLWVPYDESRSHMIGVLREMRKMRKMMGQW